MTHQDIVAEELEPSATVMREARGTHEHCHVVADRQNDDDPHPSFIMLSELLVLSMYSTTECW